MIADRRRFSLDLVATIAIVVTCAALVWAAYRRTGPAPPAIALPEAPVSLDGAATKGDVNSPVAIVMFTDYQCPFCAQFERNTLPSIEQDYIRTGRVRLAVRHLPLEAIHPVAFAAAVAATCADRQGRFWDLHASLFEHQTALDRLTLSELAQAAGLDMEAFAACVATDDVAARVRADLESAEVLRLTGTPVFLIGRVGKDGRVSVTAVLRGAQPVGEFARALDQSLADGEHPLVWTSSAAVVLVLLGLLAVRRSRWQHRPRGRGRVSVQDVNRT